MKRVLPILLLVAVVAVAIPAVLRLLESDEAAIRRQLRSAATSFDDAYLAGCLRPFAEDYRDTTRDLDRAMLGQVLRPVFLREIDPQTKAFRLRARLPDAECTVTLAEGGYRASFPLHLERRAGDSWEPVWVLQVTAVFRETEDGWRIVSSSHETR